MRKTLGLVGILVVLVVGTYVWEHSTRGSSVFLSAENLRNLFTWIGLFGILSLGQAIVIITGGIDLSVGSVVALVGIVTAMALGKGVPPILVIPAVLALAAGIGLWHGWLVTKVRIQPFVVTLCGLFCYRGITRLIASDFSQGFGTSYPRLRLLGKGFVAGNIPIPFLILLAFAALIAAYLHFSVQGRHLFALGANEEGARFSGIRTDRVKILAYVLCTLITAIGGLLIAFKVNSMGPAVHGGFYELYAIAGAVLGGCSLRGGEGNVAGVLVGASLIQVLRNLVNILSIPSELEYVVIGGAILLGICADELFRRRSMRVVRQ